MISCFMCGVMSITVNHCSLDIIYLCSCEIMYICMTGIVHYEISALNWYFNWTLKKVCYSYKGENIKLCVSSYLLTQRVNLVT
jgi:hypothetical protein